MPYIEDNLAAGEQILFRTHVYWNKILAGFVSLVGVAVLVACVIAIGGGGGFAAGLALGTLFWLYTLSGWLRYKSSQFVVTNKRVMIKLGLVVNRTLEFNLGKIESVRVTQGLFGRWLDYGDIILIGTGGSPEPFPKIEKPLGFRRALQEASDAVQNPSSSRQ